MRYRMAVWQTGSVQGGGSARGCRRPYAVARSEVQGTVSAGPRRHRFHRADGRETRRAGFPPAREVTAMFDMTKVVANALGEQLALTYQRTFGSREPRYAEIIEASARLMIERIVGSDALYHDGDHTTLVTLVAQDILRGRFLQQGVTP